MAKVRKNVAMRGLSGAIGGVVFRSMPDGSTYVSAKPDFSRRRFSEGQLAHQARMRAAASYGKAAQSDAVYVELASRSHLTAYNFAFGDFMKPPVIHAVERVAGGIRVRASDNVLVARVEVQVVDEGGEVLVRGEAVRRGAEEWLWEVEVAGRVVVRAWDLAGNVVEGELG